MKFRTHNLRGVRWAVCAGMLGTAFAGDGGYTMERSTTRPGSHRSGASEFDLRSVMGQLGAGKLVGDAFEMSSGFLVPFAATDCNGDLQVNLVDYNDVELCLTGPLGEPPIDFCACFDVNGSGHVDLADFAQLQNEFDGVP